METSDYTLNAEKQLIKIILSDPIRSCPRPALSKAKQLPLEFVFWFLPKKLTTHLILEKIHLILK